MKKKVIISALTLAIGAGLAGSITGTVAWYQYSTRTTAAYVGVTAGTSENLQMRFVQAGQGAEDGWTTKITYEQMEALLATTSYGTDMVPITTGQMAKDNPVPAKMYRNPIAGLEAQSSWQEATVANYVVIPLQFRYITKDGTNQSLLAKNVYLNDLHIAQRYGDESNHSDISDAMRIHFAGQSNRNALYSKKGETINTHGPLDLDAEPGNDYTYVNDKYGLQGQSTRTLDYGSGSQAAFAASELATSPMLLGSTSATAGTYLEVNVTIWLEGWQKLLQPAVAPAEPQQSAIWDLEEYVASEYEFGFEFASDVD